MVKVLVNLRHFFKLQRKAFFEALLPSLYVLQIRRRPQALCLACLMIDLALTVTSQLIECDDKIDYIKRRTNALNLHTGGRCPRNGQVRLTKGPFSIRWVKPSKLPRTSEKIEQKSHQQSSHRIIGKLFEEEHSRC